MTGVQTCALLICRQSAVSNTFQVGTDCRSNAFQLMAGSTHFLEDSFALSDISAEKERRLVSVDNFLAFSQPADSEHLGNACGDSLVWMFFEQTNAGRIQVATSDFAGFNLLQQRLDPSLSRQARFGGLGPQCRPQASPRPAARRIWGGLVTGTLRVEILQEGVHSGDASGVVPSSFRILRSLLDRIEDPTTGEIRVAEFHSPITDARKEQARLAAEVLGDIVTDKIGRAHV